MSKEREIVSLLHRVVALSGKERRRGRVWKLQESSLKPNAVAMGNHLEDRGFKNSIWAFWAAMFEQL